MSGYGMRFVVRLRMAACAQTESLHVAIHAAKRHKISELDVSFHSDNYAKKQNIDGKNRTAHRASSGAYPPL